MVPRLFFIYTLVTLLFPIRLSAELMIRCIEEWKISAACTGALKSAYDGKSLLLVQVH